MDSLVDINSMVDKFNYLSTFFNFTGGEILYLKINKKIFTE
jgi:hypothetical protein